MSRISVLLSSVSVSVAISLLAVAVFAVACADGQSGKAASSGPDRIVDVTEAGKNRPVAAADQQTETSQHASEKTAMSTDKPHSHKVEKSDAEWREELTPEQYRILREKGTERPYSGEYWDTKTKGRYVCAGCDTELFVSDTKFDSGCGWPSFFKPADDKVIAEHDDSTLGMRRIEVTCSNCGGHLGHVFNDGPDPTGLRYCINSASIELIPQEGAVKEAPEK